MYEIIGEKDVERKRGTPKGKKSMYECLEVRGSLMCPTET